MNLETAERRIPAARMKGGREHGVPLSPASVATLEAVRGLLSSAGLCFPSPNTRRWDHSVGIDSPSPEGDLGDRYTVHGFRSSFRDWASEQTNVPHAVAEAALAHQVESTVERSYARSDLFKKRRDLMDRWAKHATGQHETDCDPAAGRGRPDSKSRSADALATSRAVAGRPHSYWCTRGAAVAGGLSLVHP